MKKLLGIVVLGLLFSGNAYAETGKNLNWCNQILKSSILFIFMEKREK